MLPVLKGAEGMKVKIGCVLLCLFLTGCQETDRAISWNSSQEKWMGTSLEDVGADSLEQGVEEGKKDVQLLCVYVCGAVAKPGVVLLPEGSRYADALTKAGGFKEEAAEEAVNLAKQITDGEQIYFPTKEELENAGESFGKEDAGRINLNTAGTELLCTLPGIGEAKAKAIISYREKQGGFSKPEDIMQVPGIKESAYSQMKDLITVE